MNYTIYKNRKKKGEEKKTYYAALASTFLSLSDEKHASHDI